GQRIRPDAPAQQPTQEAHPRGDKDRGRDTGFRAQATILASMRPNTNTGTAAMRLSIRSITPPWPGSNVPVSFKPTLRLKRLTARSPTTDASAVTAPSASKAPGGNLSRIAAAQAAAAAATSPPVTPSQVLPGLTAGASLMRPNA